MLSKGAGVEGPLAVGVLFPNFSMRGGRCGGGGAMAIELELLFSRFIGDGLGAHG